MSIVAAGAAGLSMGWLGASTSPPKTVTVTNEVTPQSCLDALDTAEEVFHIAAQGIQAAADSDVNRLEDLTTRLDELGPKYRAAREECRAASRK